MSANCLTRGETVKQTENIFKFGFSAGNKKRGTILLSIPSLLVTREDSLESIWASKTIRPQQTGMASVLLWPVSVE
jgi:hypothetical protein